MEGITVISQLVGLTTRAWDFSADSNLTRIKAEADKTLKDGFECL